MLAVGAAPSFAQDSSGDWKNDAPGKVHKIDLSQLPAPYATKSVNNGSKVVNPPSPEAKPQVPEGFEVSLWAHGFKNPRYLETAPNGDIFVTESGANQIRVLRDADGDGKPELNEVFADKGLRQPFGLAFYPPGKDAQWLYVGNTDGVVRFPYKSGELKAGGEAEKILELSAGGRLTGGGHWTRDVEFSQDGTRLYVSVGSKSNVDEGNSEIENERARIFSCTPDGQDKKVYAYGIRNPVGIQVEPQTGALWTSVNERDGLGDDLVPDYITNVKEGGFYGWPWFYLGPNQDPRHKDAHPELKDKVTVPDVPVQAHSASLCLKFYTGTQFPEEYRGNAFAAFHGSWNREPRTGYKVVRVKIKDGKADGTYEDFMTGFVNADGNVWGRPVGLTIAADGALLVSEDGNNSIWRVVAKK